LEKDRLPFVVGEVSQRHQTPVDLIARPCIHSR
jgi:hypothetical protein